MQGVRRLARGAAVAGAVGALVLFFAQPFVAAQEQPDLPESFSGNASAAALNLTVLTPALVPVEDLFDTYVAEGRATYEPANQEGRASLVLPGNAGVMGPGLLCGEFVGPQAPEQFQPFVDAGLLMPLDDFIAKDPGLKSNFLPSVFNTAVVGGKPYGVPMRGTQPVLLFSNKKVLADAGVTAPRTWDELLAAVKTLKAKGVTPIALGGGDRWPTQMWFQYLYDRVAGPELFQKAVNGDKSVWASEDSKKALGMLKELIDAGISERSLNGLTLVAIDTYPGTDGLGNVGEITRIWNLDSTATGRNGLLLLGDGYDTANPFAGVTSPLTATADPVGMNQGELRFVEALLIYCLLAASPPISAAEQAEIEQLPDGSYRLAGTVLLVEIEERFGLRFTEAEAFDTIGGYIQSRTAAFEEGTIVTDEAFTLEILRSAQYQIQDVKLTLPSS